MSVTGRKSPRSVRGFTLIEILVALAVFSVLSVMAYSGLRVLMVTRDSTEQRSLQLAQLQTAFLLMQQDLEQMVSRSVRNEYGDREPALTTNDLAGHPLIFTRGGQRSRHQQLRSALQRIAYRLEDGTLYRLSWPVLDGAEADAARVMSLLQGVEEIDVQFLEESWVSVWPPSADLAKVELLPRAVAIELTLTHWGSVRRLFSLPQ
jgi:general secretion pathway protein J